MVIEPHMKQGRQHKLISTIFLATSVTKKLDHNNPYANALYLFCGRDSRKLKALHYDKDGFVLYQKRLDENGRFQWPRNASEARLLTRQEFRWLMEGLAIDQPKAIRSSKEKKDF